MGQDAVLRSKQLSNVPMGLGTVAVQTHQTSPSFRREGKHLPKTVPFC